MPDTFLYKDLSFQLRGIFFDIRNTYGPGHKEVVYQNLLEEYLKEKNVRFEREKSISIHAPQGKNVGIYRPDFIVDNDIILEVKATEKVVRVHEEQLYYYLRNSKYQVGFLVNFSSPRLYIKRTIYTNDRKPFLKLSV